VITIIAILAAFLSPLVALAEERANATACLSNVRQIGIAVKLYAADADSDQLPGYPTWQEFLQPYGVANLRSPGHTQGPPQLAGDSSGYALNSCFQTPLPPTPEPARTIIVATSACVLFAGPRVLCQEFLEMPDSWVRDSGEGGWLPGYVAPIGHFGSERYFGGGNYALYDGHAKWVRPSQIRIPTRYDVCDLSVPRFVGPA